MNEQCRPTELSSAKPASFKPGKQAVYHGSFRWLACPLYINLRSLGVHLHLSGRNKVSLTSPRTVSQANSR